MYLTNLIDRVRLPFRKDRESYLRLYHILGFFPHNINYYRKALIHKSIHCHTDKSWKEARLENNERLEFLGDAILGAIVGDIVYQHFEGKREGFLTNTRSKIVQRETLNRIAKEIGLIDLVQTAVAPQNSHNSYMGGNAFEALVGAIYLDRGYKFCMHFMKKRILKDYININKMAYKEVNFKSKLIEWSQKNRVSVVFDSSEKHEENSPTFFSRVLIEGIVVGCGKGYSKKESQQNAAKESLSLLKKRPQLTEQIFAEKSKKTAMEEEPIAMVEVEEPTAETVNTGKATSEKPMPKTADKKANGKSKEKNAEGKTAAQPQQTAEAIDEDMDLSHISLKSRQLSREEIVAMAEEAAFNEEINS